ncbi:hypothetical protein PBCVNW6652_984R [Paramecium bursaria Chlorella virus NW665.2]|nr:hypothetical protein PBCVNW6652_984R [Paramecium bursaria Chlorella virus NW665.2]
MKLISWFSRPHRKATDIVTESHKEFAEKLDLIEKKYADILRKFQDKLNTCMESHKELQSDNAVLRATINDLQSKEKNRKKSLPKNLTS